MNLSVYFRLARFRINRCVWPEARRRAWQAMLGLQNAVGESLCRLLFSWLTKELTRDVLEFIVRYFVD